MLIPLLLAALSGMAMPDALAESDPVCAIAPERQQAMISAGYDAFDLGASDDLSWRPVMNRGCYETAAGLIVHYLERNDVQLNDEQRRTLNFHAGQVLAFGGEDAKSVRYFERSLGGSTEWNAYAEATLAFMRHDRPNFDVAVRNYTQAAPKSPRNAVLASLGACFDMPYRAAVMCEPG